MYVSSGQFYVFTGAVCYGVLAGTVFCALAPIKKLLKRKIYQTIIDVIFFLSFSLGYVIFAFSYNFPSLRLYMPLGALSGLLLYVKSFGIILAKSAEKVYNRIKAKWQKRKGVHLSE